MSNNDESGGKKLPSKNLQIILFVVFLVIAVGIAMMVQKPDKINIPEGTAPAPSAPAPGTPAPAAPQ